MDSDNTEKTEDSVHSMVLDSDSAPLVSGYIETNDVSVAQMVVDSDNTEKTEDSVHSMVLDSGSDPLVSGHIETNDVSVAQMAMDSDTVPPAVGGHIETTDVADSGMVLDIDNQPINNGSDEENGDSSAIEDGPEDVSSTVESIVIQSMRSDRGKRVRNKFPCNFCPKMVFEYARHITHVHSDEHDIASLLAKPQNERKILIEGLRNKAVFNHNVSVLESGTGTFIVRRRSATKTSAKYYLPCPHCLTFLVTDELWKHCRSCHFKPDWYDSNEGDSSESLQHRGILASSRVLLEGSFNSNETALQKEFKSSVLNGMKRDSVSSVIKSDSLIRRYGENMYRRLGNHRANDVRKHLRQLARLLMTVNESRCNPLTLNDCIDGTNFDLVLEATEKICIAVQTESGHCTFAKPSYGPQIGYSLLTCASLKKRDAIKNIDSVSEQEADRFVAMYKCDWLPIISSRSTMTRKIVHMNNPVTLPLTEDLLKLKDYLDTSIESSMQSLRETYSYSMWRNLLEFVLASLIIFNKRRGGEASLLLRSTYNNRPNWEEVGNAEIVASLTSIEKTLLKRYVD